MLDQAFCGQRQRLCGAPLTEVVAQDTWSIRVNMKRAYITRYVAYIAHPIICLKLTQIYCNSKDWDWWGRGHFPLTFGERGAQYLLSPQYFVMKGFVVAKIFTMTWDRLNHVVICDVHRDMLSELSRQDIAKELERSNHARLARNQGGGIWGICLPRNFQNIG